VYPLWQSDCKKDRTHPTKVLDYNERMPSLRARARRISHRLRTVYGSATGRERLPALDELVCTILSQNTNDANRDQAFRALKEAFPSWEAVRDAPGRAVIMAIRPAGLAQQKAPRIQEALRRITRERGQLELEFLRAWPAHAAWEWLRSLPGVGPKTASIVMLFSLGHAAFPVDTHIYRVTERLGLRPAGLSYEAAHVHLARLFEPENYAADHLNLIRLGRDVCQARRPKCELCPLRRMCPVGRVASRHSRQV
jgi:endonuclease-3